ncbi:efflux transporter outer membrane subunit [Aliiglaciecola sp. 3_MG-2023]|uniref:efflux transporter outer membrane subunit n=1 Tax=Aliiglaciecola sp. 3_MG-2023 TaxID=3062644 RepID=UPI0026E12555|nr:efflux transporter outer membrane subunit [Aliiglaciecola sp. 3_MG-2023]MDO6695216.1 efflux transporter outer membrane subunit [Aliiglaciecola sp. 3_MG-2023]
MFNFSLPKTGVAKLLPIAGALVLAGCSTLGPEYSRSNLPVAETWENAPQGEIQGLSEQQAIDLPWKSFIKDQRLSQIIELALNNNRSLRQTLADVEAARATYRIQDANLYPTINAGLSGNRTKASSGTISTTYEAEAGLSSYEIDLFGKNRSLSEVQMEAYLSSQETAKAAKISLIGEISNAWLTLAADKNQLKLAQETASNAEKAMEITNKRLEMGVDSRIDVASAETIYYNARSDIASYTTQVEQDLNALRLLVGEQIDENLLPDLLPSSETLVADVPAGLSSSLLLQRPDVLAAEHTLKSANANIGVARAAFFPTLSLTATGGLASSVLADIFSGGASSIWTLAPSITLPIFDGGANDANLAYSEAQQQKYLAAYEYAIQSAFSEVADALARRATIQDQLNSEKSLVLASTRSYVLSLARYKGGIDNFQSVLEAQRTMYQANQSLILTKQADLENRITLYRVLGGGLADDNAS